MISKESERELLDAFIKVAPLLNKLIHDDVTVGVYDTEKAVCYIPGETFTLNVELGSPLQEGDAITAAIRSNHEIMDIVPKEVFGFPIFAKSIPIHDHNNKVIGGVGVGVSLEKSNRLHEVAENLSAIVQETAASIDDITGSVKNLASRITDVSTHMKEVSLGANQIGQISTVVKGVSDQSNLLGLNAAIEAARAGEAGRGFSVVADEIRKLANNSKENVTQIDELTRRIQGSIQNLNEAFSGINQLTDNQAAAIEEICSTINEISRNAQNLSELAGTTFRKQ